MPPDHRATACRVARHSPAAGRVSRHRTPLRAATLGLYLLLVGGCVLGPDYRRPAVPVPESWRIDPVSARSWGDGPWWRQFQDPVLDALIAEALASNLDLRIAAARITELEGRLGVERAALLPQVGAEAAIGRQRTTEAGPAPFSPQVRNPADSFGAALYASWEIDLWGRLRRANEAAQAELLAGEAVRRGVVLTLVGALAQGYVVLRSLDRQLEISRATVRARQESYRLFGLRFAGGVISELELSQARAELEAAQGTIPPIERAIAQQENALCLLLGRNPGAIPRGRDLGSLGRPAVPAGLPSSLLVKRPDIHQAEQRLIAANARIGVARAAYFPAISLSGSLGSASVELHDLFGGPARTWSWAAPLAAPIFTGGALAGQLQVAEALQLQALERYRQAIQAAFRDVEDALVDQLRTREQLTVLERQVAALGDSARLARLRYDNGYTSYIEVLDAERGLFAAEIDLTQSQAAHFSALVGLYKAMGGNWEMGLPPPNP
jgi:multidrug efflux system outer membrane protein